MTSNDKQHQSIQPDPEDINIGLAPIFLHLMGHWKKLAIVLFLGVTLSSTYSIFLPNIYKSEALLEPSEEYQGGGLSAVAGQLGGLASLAGLDISNNKTKVVAAIETIRSRDFIKNFIVRHDLLVPLFAIKRWDPENRKLIIDQDIYDVKRSLWIRKHTPPQTQTPSNEEAHEEFTSRLKIKEDKQTGLITISFEHCSPNMAQQITEKLITEINNYIRSREILYAEKSIGYLEAKIEAINVSEMRNVFYKLIEEQTKKKMLAEIREDYVFSVIDAPYLPEEAINPNRPLIIFGISMGTLIAASLLLLFWNYLSNNYYQINKSNINQELI